MSGKRPAPLDWSTNSEAARLVCEEMGYIFEVGFVAVAVGNKGHILVDYTLAKPEEIGRLRVAVAERGWCFRTIAPTDIPDPEPVPARYYYNEADPLTGWTLYGSWVRRQEAHGEPATRAAFAEQVRRWVAESEAECARLRELNAAIRQAAQEDASKVSA